MIIEATATPIDGYCTAWPARDFGTDKLGAMLAAGVRADTVVGTTRKSYVVLCESTPGITLRSTTLEHARIEALERVNSDTLILCERVTARSSRFLRKIETLHRDNTGDLVLAPSGHVIEKMLNPFNPFDFRATINKVAAGLRFEDRAFAKPYLQQYFDRMNVDWTKLGPRKIAQVLSDARAFLGTLPIEPLVGAWETRLTVKLQDVSTRTKKIIRQTFLPSVELSLSLPDQDAISNIARQPGFFVRDEFGRRSTALTNKARKIVERGLRDGLGRDEIGREIMKIGNGYWDKRGLNYARVVAANSVARARSHSELVSYRDVGIEQLEVQAVLDERTTEICRTLDGSIINVSDAWAHDQQINAITDPEDIGKVAPFLRERTDKKTGNREVVTGRGNVLSTITRSGMGVANDRGDFKLHIGPKAMGRDGITLPPYHHACRSYTVPRVSYISVPSTRAARTYPTPVTQPSRTSSPTQRPPKLFREPTRDKPVTIRNPPPSDNGFRIPGEDEFGKVARSIDEVIDDTMDLIIPIISDATLRAGRDLTKPEMGKVLRGILLEQIGEPFTGRGVRNMVPFLDGLGFRTTAINQQIAWATAMQFAGPKLSGIVRFKHVPTIRAGQHPGYYPSRDLIVVRSLKDVPGIVRGAQFYLDTLGDHRLAGNTVRNSRAHPESLERVDRNAYALNGPWIDRYDGRLWNSDSEWLAEQYEAERVFTNKEIDRYFTNDQPTALWAQIAPRFLDGTTISLATNWERFPEQVAGYIALQSGAFLEVSDAR